MLDIFNISKAVIMKTITTRLLNNILLGAIFLIAGTSAAFAGALPASALSSGWTYTENNIANAVQQGLAQTVPNLYDRNNNIMTAAVSSGVEDEILNGIVTRVIENLDTSGMALIPVNKGRGHWTALAFRRNAGNQLVILYNDSVGGALASDAEASDMVNRISALEDPGILEDPADRVIDAQVQNQTSGVACGAYTAEYLIQFAQIPSNQLNKAYVRNLLRTETILKDERVLRTVLYLKSLDPTRDTDALVNGWVNGIGAAENAQQMNSVVFNNSDHITSDLNSRMHNQVSILSASGDYGSIGYGLWVDGSIGNGAYKVKNSALFGDTKERSSKISFGGDVKLNDTYTIGAFVSLGKNSLTPSINSTTTSASKTNITSTVFGLYGNWMMAEDFMLSSNIYGGKLLTKNKDVTKIGSNRKGTLIGANLGATYFWRLLEDVVLAPSIGGNFSQLKLGKDSNAIFSVNSLTGKRAALYSGVSLSKAINISDFTLIPEILAKITYAPMMKSSKIIVTDLLSNTAVPITTAALTKKAMFSVGANLKVLKANIVELSLGYQRDWNSGYVGNTSVAKLRFNF